MVMREKGFQKMKELTDKLLATVAKCMAKDS